MLSRLSHLL